MRRLIYTSFLLPLAFILASATLSFSQPVFSIQNKKDACNNLPNGSFDILVTDGSGTISAFVFSSGAPIGPIAITLNVPANVTGLLGTVAGRPYLIVVSDDDGSSNTSTTIFLKPNISASLVSANNSSSCLTPNGSIDINVTGGSGNYTYSWTASNGFTSALQDISGLTSGNYTVVVSDAETNCTQTIGPIAIVEPPPPTNAVLNLTGPNTICNGQSTSLSIVITAGTSPFTAVIAGLGTVNNYISGTSIVVSPIAGVTYSLTSITDASGCTSPSLSGSHLITVVAPPNAGLANTVSSCNNTAAFNLFTSLLGTPAAGGTWSQLTGPTARTITGNNVDLNGATAGTYTFQYTVIGTSPCPNATAVVTVNVIASANAGIANTVSACNNTAAFNLFTSLGGTPNAGGTWIQLTGAARTITGNNVNLNGAAAGTYTFRYTVTGTSPCPNASAVVTVNVTAASNAGLANTVSSCNNTAAFNLFTSLLGTPAAGGTWSQLTGGARTITGNNVDLNGATAGAYTFQYTVTGTSPCPNATAVVTVNVVAAANAGLANTVASCNNTAAFNLFTSLGGTPSAGGAWSQLTGPGARTITGNNVDLNGAAAGTYTFRYTVTGTSPCPNASAVVTVNVTAASNAGLANTVSSCNNTAAFNLFTSLLGTPAAGGTWSQLTGGARTITGNNVDLNGATAGAYTFQYTVTGTSPCPNATAVVTVNVVATANPGLANTVPACNNTAAFNLFTSLGGTPNTGGSWSQLTGPVTRTITGNDVDLNGATAGTYTFQYTVTGTSPCPNASAVVTVNVTAASNAGLANTVSSCNNTAAFNLFTSLLGTPDVGGTWTQLSGGARTITGNNVDLNGATAGAYTFQYTVTGTSPCPNATAVVTVNVVAAANAGLANTVSACNNTAAFNLFTSLGGTPDAGGSWSQLTGGARTITGNDVDLNGATAGAYTFQYTVTGANPCPNASAVVTVNVTAASNAGLANTVSSCNNTAAFNLFTSLLGTPDVGGTWSQLTGGARTITGNNVDLNGATAGAYTFQYTVTGTSPCPNVTAVVTVNVVATANPGLANTVPACNNTAAFNLFTSLLGTPDVGGTWSQLTGGARTITGNDVDLNGAPAGTYTFQYTVTGTSPCPDATSVVTVNVTAASNAGLANTVSSCNNTAAFNLFTSLLGTPDVGGTWSQLSGGARTITGNNVDLNGATAGAYTFQYTVTGTSPCPNATAIVTVNVVATANAGLANTVSACNNTAAFNLFTSLLGTPDVGGTWSQLTGGARTITGNDVDLNGAPAGTYTFQYTVTGTSPCPDATSVVTVNVTAASNAGLANTVSSCNNTAAFNLFISLGGTPAAGGTWSQLTGGARTITGNNVDLNGATAGTYTFQYTVTGTSPCPNATAVVTVNVVATANAGLANSVSSCNNTATFNLFTSLGGTPDAGGSWSQLTGGARTITGNDVDLNGAPAGTYTFQYTVTGTSPCPDATSVVTVNVTAASNAGLANTVSSCNNTAAFNLFTSLGGTPDVGGTWLQLTGTARTITANNVELNGATAGTYTFQYTVTGTSPCPNATAVVKVNVVATANAGLANTVPACNNTAAFNLFTSLLGTPDVGGTWTQLTGGARMITGNNVDLNGATTGTYTFQYTVTGTNPCPDASSVVTVNVTAASNAGLPNTVSSCNNTAAFNLFTSLLGTPDVGGTWSQLTGGARTITGNNVDFNGATAGAYTFQYTVTGTSPCPDATAVVTVNVEATPNNALTLSATISPLCSGGVSDVSVANSEIGVSYQLRNNADNSPVGSAVAGTGSAINLSTGALTATTTFNVLATNGACPAVQLVGTVTLTVSGNIDASLTVSAQDNTVCAGSSTVIQIANSETGVDYQLRDDSDDSLIGAAIAGTGAIINLPTGNLLSAKVFNVLASNAACSIELTTTAAVNVDVNPNPSLTVGATFSPVCIGGISAVTVDNSEVGVSYQLRDQADNSLVGVAVAGTGGRIEFSTGVLAASKTYNVLATGGVCAPVQLTSTVTVAVGGSINLSLTVTPITSSVCSGAGTDIQIFNSEVGVDYRLMNAADNSFLSGLVAGTGGTLSIPTGALTIDTDIRVLVANGSCTAELTTTSTISVSPLPVTSLAVNALTGTLCSGISTMVQVVNSQAGVTYQLRDEADDSIVSGAVIGNGSTIDLPTGSLASTKTFNVIAVNGSCSAELDNKATVTVNQGPLSTISAVAQSDLVCIGTSTFVQVVNSEIGIIYQLRDNLDNSNVSGAAFGNGGTINLPTGPINADRTFNVLASNALCSTQLTTIVTVTVRAITDPLCSNCSTVIVSTINPVKVTCGATVPDGSITFQIEPAVPVVNIIGVKIEINGPTPKTQANDFVFTGLAVGNYTYIVTYGDENNPDCIKTGTFIIELSREPDPITFDLAVDEYDCLVNEGSITLENIAGAPDTDFEFTIQSNGANVTQGVISKSSTSSFTISDLLLGDYEIQLSQNQQPVNGCVGLVDSQLIDFTIAEPLGGCPVIIPNIFTPNGDGSNDFFEIRNLPASSSLSITNRWGKEVFSSSDYQNNWTAENISDGIYYYRVVAEGEVLTGWVEILR